LRRALLLAACVSALGLPAVASARPAPVTWCGTDEVAADRVPELEVSSTAQVRFVYAFPADGADNFAATASGMAFDAAWIDEWWQRQDATRSPRFDRYPFPGCTSRFGGLDIGVVRLPNGTAYYRTTDNFRRLNGDLADAFPQTEKTVVYYDGPVADTNVCGESPSNESFGGRFGIAYVFLQSACGATPVGGGASAQIAAHELIHDLGALPDGAPHPCPNDEGHPCDSPTDILYPYLGEAATLDGVTLDVGRDDYYGHTGSWWDVQDSSWLAHLPQYPLSLAVAGSGTLVVRTDTGPLDCERGCSGLTIDSDAEITAVAVPSSGWRVGGWSGACTELALSCTLTMSGPMSATVTFVRAPVRVVVRVTGKGRVTSTPRGISCPGSCSRSFPGGTSVRLTASATKGWRFAGWSGACTGRSRCALTSDGTVRARFVRR
jgi:hypothetical protein